MRSKIHSDPAGVPALGDHTSSRYQQAKVPSDPRSPQGDNHLWDQVEGGGVCPNIEAPYVDLFLWDLGSLLLLRSPAAAEVRSQTDPMVGTATTRQEHEEQR